ncbi:hypothetical protein ABZY19_35580 [Streptomyces sp. NPDC006475]|uniref:hypothetical protein n=1 Tax=Streptomyces sp. NPDC006475 TaxID=3155719 RepID=UPI0033A1F3DA
MAAVLGTKSDVGCVLATVQFMTHHTQHGPATVPSTPEQCSGTVQSEYVSGAEPRDGQWIYRKVVHRQARLNFTNGLNPTTEQSGGPAPWRRYERESWTQYGSGKLFRTRLSPQDIDSPGHANWGSPQSLRGKLAKLPDNPQQLLEVLRSVIPTEDDVQDSKDSANYGRIMLVFSEVAFIPPKVRGSLYRALGEIPGVKFDYRPVKDAIGRPALAVYEPNSVFTRDLNLREELLLDPETFQYRGKRTLYVADGKLDGKVTTKDTLVQVSALAKTAVVDNHSLRP